MTARYRHSPLTAEWRSRLDDVHLQQPSVIIPSEITLKSAPKSRAATHTRKHAHIYAYADLQGQPANTSANIRSANTNFPAPLQGAAPCSGGGREVSHCTRSSHLLVCEVRKYPAKIPLGHFLRNYLIPQRI